MSNRIIDFLVKVCRRAFRVCELVLLRIKLAINGPEASVDGLRLLVPRGVLSTQMRNQLLSGGVDGEDRRLLPRYARPGDFVLNAGSGCGLSAMAAYRAVQPGGSVIAIEADPMVSDLSRQNFALNGMQAIEARAAAVMANRETKEVVFYRKKNYYGSNLLHHQGEGKPITVPAVYPPDLIPADATGRKILLCDIEGYEATLLAVKEVIECFDVIIVELHFGWTAKNEVSPYVGMFDALYSCGFKLVDLDDEGFVFARSTCDASQPGAAPAQADRKAMS